ncbi:hypothetical protein JCM11251_001992 [Rhodosporidiobolus azoricus]
MAEQTDRHTLNYVQQVPLILTPLPTFASSSSHTLFSHNPPPQPATLWTKCSACRVELVGGINASYWSDRGELWATCGACGFSTRRGGTAASEGEDGLKAADTGKVQFQRVKKRRRVEEKRQKESLHPTAMRIAVGGAEQPRSVVAAAAPAKDMKPRTPATSTSPSPVVSARSSPRPSAVPSQPPSAVSSRSTPLATASSTSLAATVPLPPPADTKPRPSTSTSPAPPPSTSSSKLPSTSNSAASSRATTPTSRTLAEKEKDKKRKKKPSGLAEMLEAKKKRENEAKAGGAGLMDFLQGL